MNCKTLKLLTLFIAPTMLFPAGAQAQIDMAKRPALVITSEAMPATTPAPLYNAPSRAPEISTQQVLGPAYFEPSQTMVGRKVEELRTDLFALQNRVKQLSGRLQSIKDTNQAQSAAYFANTATISTQLQSGTTPGNPRLVQRLGVAQQALDDLSQNVADLNTLAVESANAASMASFLLEATRSSYSLSGAIEEDHASLSQLEDQINNTIVTVDRLLNSVNDDITRTAAYLSSERSNLQTMSLAITNGDLYGRSLANRPFSSAQQSSMMQPASLQAPTASGGARPLVKIRFDKPNVAYEQPLYAAVNEARQRFPQARYEVIAVHPTMGNAAQVAIESTRSRRNAEQVLRTLTQMGLQMDAIDLSYMPSPEAQTNEVHVYIR